MDNAQSLCHSKWDCKYHVVWIPKCRRKVLFGRIRKDLAEYLHELARQKECKILEGHLCSDHVHMLISIPPKYSVAQAKTEFADAASAESNERIEGTFLIRQLNFELVN